MIGVFGKVEFFDESCHSMARVLVCGERRGPYEIPNRPSRPFVHGGIPLGQYGSMESIPIKITTQKLTDGNLTSIRVHARFMTAEDDNFGLIEGYSRCGFLLGMHDSPTGEDANAIEYFPTSILPTDGRNEYQRVNRCGFDACISQWKFGKSAELKLRVNESGKNSEQSIRLFVRPFYPKDIDEISIQLTITAQNGHKKETVADHSITFQKDRYAESTVMDQNEWYRDLGAFNWKGEGSSIHPKQLHTSHALKKTIREHFPKKKAIKIAYIGPDTTENLRTVIRTLAEIRKERKFKSMIYIIYDEKWDIPKLNPFANTPLDLSKTPPWLEIQGIEMSDLQEGELAKSLDFPNADANIQTAFVEEPKTHITLATYVSPWSIGTDEESRIRYESVIDKTMGAETKLITIDPGKREYCVLSLPPDATSKNDLHDFYEKRMKLNGSQIIWNNETQPDETGGELPPQINAYLWERSGGWG